MKIYGFHLSIKLYIDLLTRYYVTTYEQQRLCYLKNAKFDFEKDSLKIQFQNQILHHLKKQQLLSIR